MNPFMCVVDLSGDTVGIDALVAALPAVGRAGEQTEVMLHGAWGAAWVPAESFGRPAIAHRDGILALGSARITNRAALRPGGSRTGGGDLELIIERYLEHDTAGFRDLVGDFAVVLWDTRAHRLVAVRDALGVKTLFYQRTGNRLVVGSHLECFESARYDRSFLGDMLLGLRRGTERTVFADVTRLLPGTSLTADALGVRTRRYWDPAEFVAADAVPSEREAIAEFRRLFREAVLAQLDDGVSTWAQLSGGLDSSSVVAMAQGLAREGLVAPLAGTQTVVDSLAEGDETRYSDAVVRQYGLRNERIADYAAWQDDGQPPPDFSDPRLFLPFYARDRALRDVVRNAGGKVLLSGYGADNYLAGTYDYLADWVARGRIKDALGDLVNLAVASRRSFWGLGIDHILVPLGPMWLKRRRAIRGRELPSWFAPDLVREQRLDERILTGNADGAPGEIYARLQAEEIGSIDMALERGVFEEGVEVRYPFLHRPLVEFCLRLPLKLRFRPGRAKWILREAMGDALPDVVRNRPGKGAIDGRLIWSLQQHHGTLERLVEGSHLAELGYVCREKLKQALDQARRGATEFVTTLFFTLSLEMWFAVRSGRWARQVAQLPKVVPNQPVPNFSEEL